MKIPFMDLTGCYREIYDQVLLRIRHVIDHSDFIGGKEVSGFEEEFSMFCNVNHAVGCANGTDALMIALKALGIGEGDIVLTVPNTFIATAEAVTAVGAKVDFVDIDPDTHTLSPVKLQEYLENSSNPERIKAVIPVHLYGQMADMEAIIRIAGTYHLKVIEDAAQAHGAKWNGKGPGEFGDLATFSFFPGKNLGGFGDAGAVVTNDPELSVKVRMLANHGRIEKYKHEMEGYNSRLDAIQAAVLRVKLQHLEKWTNMRIENAKYYNKLLKGKHAVIPMVRENCKHVYHLYVIRARNRDGLAQLLKQNGISTGIHYPIPLHLQPAYRYLGYKEGDFPIAEKSSKEILSLPMWPELTEDQMERVCQFIN
jgi:dTDP-4-amino-4,6-dideoxygalactose transaminase